MAKHNAAPKKTYRQLLSGYNLMQGQLLYLRGVADETAQLRRDLAQAIKERDKAREDARQAIDRARLAQAPVVSELPVTIDLAGVRITITRT